MARKKRKGSRSRSGLGGVSSMVRRVGMGMLGAMVLGSVANKFAPQYAGIASIAGAYMTGGAVGALGTVFLQGFPSVNGGSAAGVTVI